MDESGKNVEAPRQVTCMAPINIALIKYWGKQQSPLGYALNLPLNDSISLTLSKFHIHTVTTVTLSPQALGTNMGSDSESSGSALSKREKILFSLNGRKGPLPPRLDRMLLAMRETGSLLDSHTLRIKTENNFPISAGMASSASGCAALAYALTSLFPKCGIPLDFLAQMGSGSAVRSVHGGFVHWECCDNDKAYSLRQIFHEVHWPKLNVLCLVLSDDAKKTGSSEGMHRSARTSRLMFVRLKTLIKHRVKTLYDAISRRDFSSFANIVMKESDELHALCYTACPPIKYLNLDSFALIELVRRYNTSKNKATPEKTSNKTTEKGDIPSEKFFLAYTFDAGLNPFIFFEDQSLTEVFYLILSFFAPISPERIFVDPNHLTDIFQETASFSINEMRYKLPSPILEKLHGAVNEVSHQYYECEGSYYQQDKPLLHSLYHFTPGTGPVMRYG